MTEIPDRPFDKIAIDLVTECETSTSGNKHILTIIDHLTGGQKHFPSLTNLQIQRSLHLLTNTNQYTCAHSTF